MATLASSDARIDNDFDKKQRGDQRYQHFFKNRGRSGRSLNGRHRYGLLAIGLLR